MKNHMVLMRVMLLLLCSVSTTLRWRETPEPMRADWNEAAFLPNIPQLNRTFESEIKSAFERKDNHTIISFSGFRSISHLFKLTPICNNIEKVIGRADYRNTPIIIDVSMNCGELFRKSSAGSGNFVFLVSTFKLLALAQRDTSLSLRCSDASKEPERLILPWLMGWFPSANALSPFQPTGNSLPSITLICESIRKVDPAKVSPWHTIPMGYMVTMFQHELRRMAIALVGVPNEAHPSFLYSKAYLSENVPYEYPATGSIFQQPLLSAQPLLPGVDLDDVAIHFRCGDLVVNGHPGYSFYKFQYFATFISPSARSIGILTQPFEKYKKNANRPKDDNSKAGDRCRRIGNAFVQYLEAAFPRARVTIRNGPNETVALSYARMIMANQTLASASTFSGFPAVASFGTGYIPRPDPKRNPRGPNQCFLYPRPIEGDGVVFSEEQNVLNSVDLVKTIESPGGEAHVVNWFSTDNVLFEKYNAASTI